MAEENKPSNGNGTRKWFPGVRIIEGLLITLGASILITVGGYVFLVPKMNYDVDTLCKSVAKIEAAVEKMANQIISLQITDIKHDGELNLLHHKISTDRKKRESTQ